MTKKNYFQSFVYAREFVRHLGFKNTREWREYVKSGEKPSFIPSAPDTTYKDKGWISFVDWLDTHNVPEPKARYWLPFAKAREFARKLELKNCKEWTEYCKSGNRPSFIPACPNILYKNKGWVSYGDWLGTGNTRLKQFLSFEEARSFARNLGFNNVSEWWDYRKSGFRPDNIPSNPVVTYKGKGWDGFGDWLGIESHKCKKKGLLLPFEEARSFARNLGFNSLAEWYKYKISANRPFYIPSCPHIKYKDKGWGGYADWLGTTNKKYFQKKDFLPFEEARTFARTLGVRGDREWRSYCKSGLKPNNLPSTPCIIYKNKGWVSLGDWLGTGNKRGREKKDFLPFEEARTFVRNLGLKNAKEWREYCKSVATQNFIPSTPYTVYKNEWISFGDWLGADNKKGPKKKDFLPFEEARNFMHNLRLKNKIEFDKYCKSGSKPGNIPWNPHQTYKDKGWISWMDWLGNDNKKFCKKDFLPFEEAQTFTRNLGLKNVSEWHKYCKSGDKPSFIPSKPEIIYKNKGWGGYGDWLGTGNKKGARKKDFLPFEEARTFARNLGFNNVSEWHKYCKSGDKPSFIPSSPKIIYKNKGWINWVDWLGTDNVARS